MNRPSTKRHLAAASHGHGDPVPSHQAVSWDLMEEKLTGLGPFLVQLDNLRLSIPSKLRAPLGDTLHQPWMMVAWSLGCLRLIPQGLWGEYSRRICTQLNDANTRSATEMILRTTTRVEIDGNKRWNLPTFLVNNSDIGAGGTCLVVTNKAWVEIWSFAAWDRRLKEAMQIVAEASNKPSTLK